VINWARENHLGTVKRILALVRSVIPEDPRQLMLIAGAECLFIGALLPWGPRVPIHIRPLLNPLLLQPLGQWIILFSGTAAFFLCFRSGSRPARLLFMTVLLPALVGFAVEFGLYLYGATHFLKSRTGAASVSGVVSVLARIARIATGFHYALIGTLLVASFALCLRLNRTSLPLALPRTDFQSADTVPWRRLCIVIWVLITWFPALWAGSLALLAFDCVPVFAHLGRNAWVAAALSHALPFGAFLLFAASLLGKEVWRTLRYSLRLPKPEMFLLALGLSFGVVLGGLAIDYYLLGFEAPGPRITAFSFLLFYLLFPHSPRRLSFADYCSLGSYAGTEWCAGFF